VLAAHRAGIKTVIIPERNVKDMVDVPKQVQKDLKIVPVAHMDQVLEIALSSEVTIEPPRPRKPAREEEEQS
jgi:ATP-dependent Lon protease